MDWGFIRKSLIVSCLVALPVAAGLQVLFIGFEVLGALAPSPRADLPGPIEWSWSWVLVAAGILEAVFILVFLAPYTVRAYKRHLIQSGRRLPRLPRPGVLFVGLWFGWMALLMVTALTTAFIRVVLPRGVSAPNVALIVGLVALCIFLLFFAWRAQRSR